VSKPFVINRHGRLVFPSNFTGELDFSALETVEQLTAVVQRDFAAKAPTGTEVLQKATSGGYATRADLLRDLVLYLFWSNRFAMTMYEKRPMRWRDVPRRRDDLFLPVLTPWEDGERKVAAIADVYHTLPPTWDGDREDHIHGILFDVFRHKLHHATGLQPVKPTVAEMLAQPESLTYCLTTHEPDYPVYSYAEILDCDEAVPELESLHRLAMVLHNQYPWDRAATRLEQVGRIGEDEFVVLFVPRNNEVMEFIRHVRRGRRARPHPAPPETATPHPAGPVAPVVIDTTYAVKPRLEALSVAKGEHVCRNSDVVRNGAYSWSPMAADEITAKTGIEQRTYTEKRLEVLALSAAQSALEFAGRRPEEIAAVIFCSCTTSMLLPSVATWLSGQLGTYQTHASFDLIAACAGFPYGLAEATRILQDVRRPVLVVCAEKFSDKIGTVRTSRMIFGDGASAMVVAPAEDGRPSDLEVVQTYASGPVSEVNSIIWPNPEFDNDITVWGPEVRSLVDRYLKQMMGELRDLPAPDGATGPLVDAIDLVVPHQANRTMVVKLAKQAGLSEDQLYFNIDRVGNMSAASIPVAIHDAVTDGVIDRPMRVFTPGFGAGAVAGYAVLRVDPAIIVPEDAAARDGAVGGAPSQQRRPPDDDVRAAFG
jgi:3-oxoacyl-[acyl-carrier-protein] synthase III